MIIRDGVCVEGTPLKWRTNLSDEEIRGFYALYKERISEPSAPPNASSKIIFIPLRFGHLPFLEGYCFWGVSKGVHTVLYRSSGDWELWEARMEEIDELRKEQAEEEAIEIKLTINEDAYLKEMTESAITAKQYEKAAAYVTARADFRRSCKKFKTLPIEFSLWTPIFIFARIPISRYGIEFFSSNDPLPQHFSNFAHWFSVSSGLKGDSLVEETRRIYSEGMGLFPDSGNLAKAASLFFRRVGKYNLAMAICEDAIKRGLKDDTKSGFAGRLKRLQQEFAEK